MTSNSRDPWALESDDGQVEADRLRADEQQEPVDPWRTESPFENVMIENTTPETSAKYRWTLMWRAIGHALRVFETREEVDEFVLSWNQGNDPRLDEYDLLRKVDWALLNYPSKLKGTA